MRKARSLAFLILALVPLHLFAWGKLGHQTVAAIAESRLDASTKEKLAKILGTGTHLDAISLCADDIKRHHVKCADVFDLKMASQTKGWHYIDLPIGDDVTKSKEEDYCEDQNCILDQIPLELAILGDEKASKFERQQAIMYLVHFFGDLHQPLHCATKVLDDNGTTDTGGNDDPIYFLGLKKATNLHHLWDNIIMKDSEVKKADPAVLAEKLEKKITAEDAKKWEEGDLADWALESYKIAKDKIYPAYEDGGDHVGAEYRTKMQPIAYKQIEKAGVRLAHQLELSLK